MSLLVSMHAIRFKKLACQLFDSFSNEDFRDAQNGYIIFTFNTSGMIIEANQLLLHHNYCL